MRTKFLISILMGVILSLSSCALKNNVDLTISPSTCTLEPSAGSATVELNDESWILYPRMTDAGKLQWSPAKENTHNNEIKEYTFDGWVTFTRTGDKSITVTVKANTGGERQASMPIIQVHKSDKGYQGPYYLNVIQKSALPF